MSVRFFYAGSLDGAASVPGRFLGERLAVVNGLPNVWGDGGLLRRPFCFLHVLHDADPVPRVPNLAVEIRSVLALQHVQHLLHVLLGVAAPRLMRGQRLFSPFDCDRKLPARLRQTFVPCR